MNKVTVIMETKSEICECRDCTWRDMAKIVRFGDSPNNTYVFATRFFKNGHLSIETMQSWNNLHRMATLVHTKDGVKKEVKFWHA